MACLSSKPAAQTHGKLQRITYRFSGRAKWTGQWTGQRSYGREAPGLSLTTVQSVPREAGTDIYRS